MPLGSLPVLRPPAGLAGPVTPLIAVLPAPGDPAVGAAVTPPVAEPVVPPDEAAPPLDAPALPPPPPPPPLCANAVIGAKSNVVASKILSGREAGIGLS